VNLLSHPFRLGPTRAAATVAEGTDQALAEAIAVLALTRKGERPLVPEFGLSDPAFDDFDVAELNAQLATYGPDVTIVDVTVDVTDDTTATAVLTFDA
jgi:hypothetical protein